MIGGYIGFRVVFSGLPQPVSEVWRQLADFLIEEGLMPPRLEVSQLAGHPVETKSETRLKLKPNEIEALIRERNLDGFHVDAAPKMEVSHSLRFNDATGEAVLWSRMDHGYKGPDSWARLISGLLERWPNVGGWQWNSTYSIWQGASELHQYYESWFGVVPPGARRFMKTRGSDDPREFIDVSGFPGRFKVISPGSVCYLTSEMWLGSQFWKYAKCTKEEVLAADFFLEKRDTPHFLYLKSWPEPFSRPDGEQGRQQQRLWKLFFHEDCEWPPGSGGICDEPMYGPPELMPGYKEKQE